MSRARIKPTKTERLNLCLTRADREALEFVAEREDRDLGYVAGWFLRWGIEQYRLRGGSLVDLKSTKIEGAKKVKRYTRERLALREEAQREHEESAEGAHEKKRA